MEEVEDEEDSVEVVFPSFEGQAEGEVPAGRGWTQEDEEEEGRGAMTVLEEEGEDEGGFCLREKEVIEDWFEEEGGVDWEGRKKSGRGEEEVGRRNASQGRSGGREGIRDESALLWWI